MCARRRELTLYASALSEVKAIFLPGKVGCACTARWHQGPGVIYWKPLEVEYTWKDPKGSDLCVVSLKASESLLEERTRVDVQITDWSYV